MPQAVFVNADAITQLAGTVVRTGAVSGQCLLASSDLAANYANLLGVRIDDVAAGASGTLAAFEPGLRVRMAVEPHPNDVVYLASDGSGTGVVTAPANSVELGICYAALNVAGAWYAYLVVPLSANSSSPTYLTAKGDLLTFDGASLSRLPVGTDGQVLTSRETAPNGIDWETPATTLSPAGSIFSLTGPLSAAGAVLGWDFSRYDPSLTLAQNLYNCNISGDPLNATPVAAGTPTYNYRGLLAGGFSLNPALASNQGGALQDDAGTNAGGSTGNSVWAIPANNDVRIISALTIEAFLAVSAMTTATGDNWSIATCCGEGETEGTNILYQLGVAVSAGPVITVTYVAEHDAGVNITATLAVIQSPVGTGLMYLTFTRDSTGKVRLYINGQAVTSLITPVDAGGGGVLLPTRGAVPTQTLQLSRVGTQGTNTKQWQALKITPACFTPAQVQEAYRRSRFGVGSTIS